MGRKYRKKKQSSESTQRKITFSKTWVGILLTCSICWITCSYILAFFDKADIAQELSIQVVIVVVSTVLGYFLKSYFETKEEEKNKLTRDHMKYNNATEEIHDDDNILL